jgi:hypothetical protein
MGADRGNRVSFLAWMAASSFGVGLLVRGLDRLGATVVPSPALALALALALPPLLYRRLRPQRRQEVVVTSAVPASRPLVFGAGPLETEEGPHAGL